MTGKSTLITDGGEVGERTPIYEPALLVGEVQMRDAGPTLYTHVGDWVQVAAALGLVIVLLRRRPAPPEETEEVSRPAHTCRLRLSADFPSNFERLTAAGGRSCDPGDREPAA